jgi:hypothetical protein
MNDINTLCDENFQSEIGLHDRHETSAPDLFALYSENLNSFKSYDKNSLIQSLTLSPTVLGVAAIHSPRRNTKAKEPTPYFIVFDKAGLTISLAVTIAFVN